MSTTSLGRSRWAAIGAAIAISVGAVGFGIVDATVSSGERLVYVPIEPCRIMDTRADFQVGPRGTPIGAGETYTVDGLGVTGDCDLPGNVASLAMNVTAVRATQRTFLTFWEAGSPRPDTSVLNPAPGEPPTPNAVSVALSDEDTGRFSVYNRAGTVEVFADVYGFYTDHAHDDRYLHRDEIVLSHAPGFWVADTVVDPPLSFNYITDMAKLDGSGTAFMPLVAPERFGTAADGTEYIPAALEVCFPSIVGDAYVNEVTLQTADPTLTAFNDDTDITAAGCHDYDLTGAGSDGESFTVTVEIRGEKGYVMLGSVNSTWAPRN
jgi:hypothetical protein